MKPSRSTRVPARPRRAASLTLAAATFMLLAFAVSPALARPLVVIDAGHGGPYNHARYRRLPEKQANLLFALELGRQMNAAGWDVVYTRTYDTAVGYPDIATWHWIAEQERWLHAADGGTGYPDGTPRDDLQARCNVANDVGADLFISIHCNGSASRRAVGTENWAAPNDVPGAQLGQYVQTAVLRQTRQRNRGAGIQGFYVTRWANMPALLIETGFMSSPTEGSRIANASWRRTYVSGIVNGVNTWMSTNPYAPTHPRYAGTPSDTAIIASRAMWPSGAETVVLASATDIDNALAAPFAAGRLDAPVLLADGETISTSTLGELARLHPSKLLVLASAETLTDEALAATAAAIGLEPSAVQRVYGPGPLGTAAGLAQSLASTETSLTVVVAKAASLTDTVGAGVLAASRENAVLLLAHGDGSLPPEAQALIDANADNIAEAILIGVLPEKSAGGIQKITRINRVEPYATAAAITAATRPTGAVRTVVYNPAVPSDAIVAGTVAAQAEGGALLPVRGRYFSPYTREWLENNGGRVWSVTIVGSYAVEPPLVDHMILKALR